MTTAKFRMHRITGAFELALNSSQRAVLELPKTEVAAIFGAPSSGKTTTLKALVFHQVLELGESSDSVLVISASRQNANRLRDELALGLQSATKGPVARTLSSVAFAVVSAKALASGEPAPELVSGSEQDTLLAQILEELEQKESLIWPESIHKNTLKLPDFRTEIRELFTVATEHQISPEKLAELSGTGHFGVWYQVSKIYGEYLARLKAFDHERFDSAQLLHRAADLLDSGFWPDNLARPAQVLVDDAQELTPGATRLLKSVVGQNCGLLLFGDPDASTLGFRASDSKAMSNLVSEIRATRGISGSAPALFLETRVEAKPALLGHVLGSISERLSPDLAGRHRFTKLAKPDWAFDDEASQLDTPKVIETASFASSAIEVAWVADRMRFYHLELGVEWRDMAVVARSRRQLEELELTLSNHQVPARVGGAQSPLRDEFGSRSLLQVASVVVEAGEIDLPTIGDLLENPFVHLNNLEVRRLRRTLRFSQKDSQDPRNSDELMVELFNKPGAFAELRSRELGSVRKFIEKIHLLRENYSSGNLGVEQLLWQIYDGSQTVSEWLSETTKHDQIAAQANRNLDSISALFA
ncbi:MAG: UvrD-helicase domain-containing protein, partial [Actinomycetes bacterium]